MHSNAVHMLCESLCQLSLCLRSLLIAALTDNFQCRQHESQHYDAIHAVISLYVVGPTMHMTILPIIIVCETYNQTNKQLIKLSLAHSCLSAE